MPSKNCCDTLRIHCTSNPWQSTDGSWQVSQLLSHSQLSTWCSCRKSSVQYTFPALYETPPNLGSTSTSIPHFSSNTISKPMPHFETPDRNRTTWHWISIKYPIQYSVLMGSAPSCADSGGMCLWVVSSKPTTWSGGSKTRDTGGYIVLPPRCIMTWYQIAYPNSG